MTDPNNHGNPDTTPPGDDRDVLSTDDGLRAAAADMPVVDERDNEPGEDAQDPEQRQLLELPDLDVDEAGADPCAAHGAPPYASGGVVGPPQTYPYDNGGWLPPQPGLEG